MRVLSPASLQLVTWESPGWPEKLADAHRGDTDGEASTRLRGSSSSPRLYRALAREQQVGTALIGFSDTSPVIVTLDRRGGEKVNLQYVSANFLASLESRRCSDARSPPQTMWWGDRWRSSSATGCGSGSSPAVRTSPTRHSV